MNVFRLLPTLAFLLISSFVFGTDYYSISDGDWSDGGTWSLDPNGSSPAGPPSANDNVTIRHSVTHDAGLGYIHYGNILIEATGTYSVGTGGGVSEPYFFAGDVFEVYGRLITSSDFEHQLRPGTGGTGEEDGVLLVHATAIMDIGDDLILNSRSYTMLDNAACGDGWCRDDIYFVGPTAQICGDGKFIVPDLIRAWANVDKSNELDAGSGEWQAQLEGQICKDFSLYGTAQDCNDDNPRFTGQASFPVELISFEAQVMNEEVQLSWATASEVNNDFFTIERSTDGLSFQPIAYVQGAGNSERVTQYQQVDANPLGGKMVYRLKQTDFDGQFSYSQAIEVNTGQMSTQLDVYPNPSTSHTLQLAGWDQNQTFTLTITELNGRILLQQEIQAQAPQPYYLQLSSNLASGVYLLSISNEYEQLSQKLIIR